MRRPIEASEAGRWVRAGELLEQVLDLPVEQRAAAAARLGAEHQVETELNSLLQATLHDSVLDESLHHAVQGLPAELPRRSVLQGQTFGRWTLGEEIGRGGMSVVYHATRQGDGFEQHAALKILAISFLGDAHIEGFLRERRILSELHHPGIARLVDGGITPEGAPYFVMDFIEGLRIDRWCQQNNADIRTIGRLMLALSRAVAYAQRHFVVHRDINPSNVMVDSRGQPQLIDFGIAKLLGDAPPHQTVHAFTPEFAAPEQQSGGSVTTATDVYGLGMLFRHLAKDKKLDRDLQLVLAVATHQDTDQRYSTARHLADDIEAWLENRPLQARPDSVGYRGRKFARRHWRGLAATLCALVIGAVGLASTWHQTRITQRETVKRQAMADFMLDLFEQADLMRAGADLRVSDLLETAAEQAQAELVNNPETLVALLNLIASGQTELTNYDESRRLLDKADELIGDHEIPPGERARTLQQRGKLAHELGDYPAAIERTRQAIGMLGQEPALQQARMLASAELVSWLVDAEQYDLALETAEVLHEEVLAAGVGPEILTAVTHRYAVALEVTGNLEPAYEQYRNALELQREYHPGNGLGRAAILSDYAIARYFGGQYVEAERMQREVLEIYSEHFEAPHPRISSALHNIALSLSGEERFEEAVDLLRQSWAMSVQLHGQDHIESLLEQATLGVLIGRTGGYVEAEQILRENLAALERTAPEMKVQRGSVLNYLADVLLQTNRLEESRAEYQKALALFDELPRDHIRVVEVNERLLEIAGKLDDSALSGNAE